MAVQYTLVPGGIVRGDAFPVERTVHHLRGRTVTKAWLTVKDDVSDSDLSALIQKTITSTDVPGTGKVTGTAVFSRATLRFDLTNLDTGAGAGGQRAYYDIQILLDNNERITLELGYVDFIEEITVTTT